MGYFLSLMMPGMSMESSYKERLISTMKGRKIKEGRSVENPTRHKNQEAHYFLSKMKEFFKDDEIFAYNLSAFLSAARSITLYMQKQYKHQKGFDEWYSRKQIKMSADPELQYLKHARTEDPKTESVATVATRIKTSTMSVTIV